MCFKYGLTRPSLDSPEAGANTRMKRRHLGCARYYGNNAMKSMKFFPKPLAHVLLALAMVFTLAGCAVEGVAYYPGSARVTYDYWYYPSVGVYYDSRRSYYHYYSGSRWVEASILPSYLYGGLGTYVVINSRDRRPWYYYDDHRRHYPPERYRGKPPPPRRSGPPPRWDDNWHGHKKPTSPPPSRRPSGWDDRRPGGKPSPPAGWPSGRDDDRPGGKSPPGARPSPGPEPRPSSRPRPPFEPVDNDSYPGDRPLPGPQPGWRTPKPSQLRPEGDGMPGNRPPPRVARPGINEGTMVGPYFPKPDKSRDKPPPKTAGKPPPADRDGLPARSPWPREGQEAPPLPTEGRVGPYWRNPTTD